MATSRRAARRRRTRVTAPRRTCARAYGSAPTGCAVPSPRASTRRPTLRARAMPRASRVPQTKQPLHNAPQNSQRHERSSHATTRPASQRQHATKPRATRRRWGRVKTSSRKVALPPRRRSQRTSSKTASTASHSQRQLAKALARLHLPRRAQRLSCANGTTPPPSPCASIAPASHGRALTCLDISDLRTLCAAGSCYASLTSPSAHGTRHTADGWHNNRHTPNMPPLVSKRRLNGKRHAGMLAATCATLRPRQVAARSRVAARLAVPRPCLPSHFLTRSRPPRRLTRLLTLRRPSKRRSS